MKKILCGLMSLAAIAAMTSCSNEESVANQQSATALENQLRIYPMVNANMRAAYEFSTSSINRDGQQFRLIATGNFVKMDKEDPANPYTMADIENANDKVTAFDDVLTYNGGYWNLSTNVVPATQDLYWADKKTKATFHAIAPKDITEGEYIVKGGVASEGYNAAADCRTNQQDIIVAYNEGVKKDFITGVPINFRHVLSRVQFKAVNKDYTNGMFLEVVGMKLVNISSKANLTYPNIPTGDGFAWEKYSPWATVSSAMWYYAKSDNMISILPTAANMITGDDFYLMPQQLTAADGDFLKQTEDKSKAYVSFLIRAYYTDETNASKTVKNAANTLKNIWPYAKVATAFTDAAGRNFAAGKFVDKTTYDGLTTEEKANISMCAESEGYAWAVVPIDTNWEPGKKYVYTLNYSAAGIGMTDPEDSAIPGEDIIPESPLKLWFNVTVSDWDEVAQNQNV